ncbi:helix-turn-helix domain-containing protein [Hymenobacter metallilatus]|uniref:Helix-turn-helix domain-containing protein n=1 Tax=Hymenobacter metallilatus TaxID=2493666 RepID=A0A3R9M7M4_9BACT|nr:helix-turn-helix transcriptional regulator [Hymenobacter metallilatus]RSK34477.1 helix-turn-helix domain-containing protein [Hymenobacter metallilatus]
MLERIRQLLTARQLSPSQFADAVGVARPIISHILSGRNKPSLEVVQKILAAFPDLSVNWLLLGAGDMQASSEEPEPAATKSKLAAAPPKPPKQPAAPVSAAPSSSERTAATEIAQAPPKEAAVVSAEHAAVAVAPAYSPASAMAPLEAAPAITSTAAASHAEGSQGIPLAALAEPGKRIRRIVIFYQDGTFSDYQPEPGS